MDLIFEAISQKHDRSDFDCEEHPLNEYLKKFARQNHEKGISLTIVALSPKQPRKILGYYSVSSGQIEFKSLPPEARKRIPKYPVPIMRIGRLAVDKESKGRGIGVALLVNALARSMDAAKIIGVYAVLVDVKSDTAKAFYKKFGFIELIEQPMVLFIPISVLKDAVS